MRGLPASADAVIVGGGASGLSLAIHLAEHGWRDRDVVVVDDGARPLAARAWAFWARSDRAVAPVVASATRSFDRFWVHGRERSTLVPLDAYRYSVVRGADLDRAASTAFARAEGFRRVEGHVERVEDGARDVRRSAAVVVAGHELWADWVFDSVGIDGVHERSRQEPEMVLDFVGHRVETEAEVFDPSAPTLMDFRTPQSGGLAFVYVLPSSPRTALVEHTRYSPRAPGPGQVQGTGTGTGSGEAALGRYVRDVLGIGTHQVVGTERGTIALVPTPPRVPGRRVIPIGAEAGLIKASTGYGFVPMQRHGAAVARSLAAHDHPFAVPAARARYRVLDRLMLAAIRDEPARVIESFERLFSRNSGDRVLAFLDESTTIGQELSLIATLPPPPFLRAALTLAKDAMSAAHV